MVHRCRISKTLSFFRYVGVCCPDSYLYKIYTGQSFSGNPAGYLPAIGVDLAPVIDAIIEDEEKTNSNRENVNEPDKTEEGKPEENDEKKKIVFEDRRGKFKLNFFFL